MTTPAPGWYPDPAGGDGSRWWDGAQWTEHLQPATDAAARGPADPWRSSSVTSPTPSGWGGAARPGASSWGGSSPAYPQQVEPENFWRQNRYSLSAIGFAALYVVLLLSVHVALIGVVPVILTVRAWRAKEQLAVAASIVAAAAVVLVIYGLTR